MLVRDGGTNSEEFDLVGAGVCFCGLGGAGVGFCI